VLKGSVSAICEPVKINLYLNDAPVTVIQAENAIVDPRRRRMILRDNVQVISGISELSTNRLAIYPETGLFEVDHRYVLKSQDDTVTGEKLTTDFFLKQVSMQ
jgi:lipopolysaccharide export system protein LptA